MRKPTRRGIAALAVAAALSLAALGGAAFPAAASSAQQTQTAEEVPAPAIKPTIVFVHGAFADSSGWSLVAAGLKPRDTRSSRSRTRCAGRSTTVSTCDSSSAPSAAPSSSSATRTAEL